MAKFSIKDFSLVIVLSLTLVTIISSMLSQYTNIPVLKSGGAFILLLGVVMLTYLFVIARDGKIDRKEILTIVIVAVILVAMGIILKRVMPEIFSALPISTQNFFSAFPQTTKELFSVFG